MHRILLVDDQAVNRQFLATLLRYGNYRVLEARDGAEALAQARAERPDLVIADILMPTMDGYEFVRQLRQDPAISSTPVIFCTAMYHELEALELARACGVSHVLTKPTDPEVLLDTIGGLLNSPPICAPTPPAGEFDRQHLRLLSDKLSEHVERLSTLLEVGRQLASERDPMRIPQLLADCARGMTGARYALVKPATEEGSFPQVSFVSGVEEQAARKGEALIDADLIARLLAEDKAVRLRNTGFAISGSQTGTRSLLAAPLLSPSRRYGIVCLVEKLGAEEFTAEDEQVAVTLAAQAAVAYENARRYEELQRRTMRLEQEVAERRQISESLRASELRFRLLLESAPDTLVITGSDRRIRMVNAKAESLFCCRRQDMEGRLLETFVAPAFRQKLIQRYSAPAAASDCLDLRIARTDGGEVPVEVTLGSVATNEGLLVLSVIRDVSQRVRLEEQFRQAQKMEAIGTLAGGIAHDFNNLLTVIAGYGQMLRGELEAQSSRAEMMDEILRAAERARRLTQQLLAFSRKQMIKPQVCDVNALVAETAQMLRRVIGEDVELTTVLDPHLSRVKVDLGQIEQVIMNLVVNARDAMPRGGHLTIETANVSLDVAHARALELNPGDYVSLAVSDTGCGMDRETQARIFEPFFTTKGAGKGTGLGLATVYGMLRQSRGAIEVQSQPGHGSTFTIYLPVTTEAETAPHRKENARGRGSETVLLVEDDPSVRKLVRSVLTRNGYAILEATDVQEAVRLCRDHQHPIHLLLTDVVMPQMSGADLANRISTTRPEMKVLFMSGYADDAVSQYVAHSSAVSILRKPFDPEQLMRAVRHALNGARRGRAVKRASR